MKTNTLHPIAVSAFCESIAMMLHAGIQIDEAAALLIEDEAAEENLSGAIRSIVENLEKGSSFGTAVRECGAFPEYAVNMIEIGETSGSLEEVLIHLAAYYENENHLKERIRGALRYPMAMLAVVTAVLVVMVARILPVFSEVYEGITGSVKESAYWYVNAAYGICWAGLALMLVLLAGLLVVLVMQKTPEGREKLFRILEKAGPTRSIMENLGLYRFVSVLGVQLSAGEEQDRAVEFSAGLVNCVPVETRLKICRQHMEEGQGLATAAYKAQLFEPVYGRMLLAGAKAGSMDTVLDRLRELLAESTLKKIEDLINVIDPILSGILMATVGVSLISVMLPLIGIMNSIG